MSVKKPKLIYVEWWDSHSPTYQEWRTGDNVKQRNKERMLIQSIGWLVDETKDSIAVVPHVRIIEDGSADNCQGELMIPKCSIKRRKFLKHP